MERKRGCGWRKIGGLYLCGEGIAFECRLLPYELHNCPCCGAGVKFTRSFQWLESAYFIDKVNTETAAGGKCTDCPMNSAVAECGLLRSIERREKFGLMWIGEAHYSPASFVKEALDMGISKRITSVPKELELGETWVMLAHKKAVERECDTCRGQGYVDNPDEEQLIQGLHAEESCPECDGEVKIYTPAIFYAFRPTRIEKIVTEDMLDDEERKALDKRGITPVVVPDEAKHRNGKTTEQEELL